MENNQQQNVNLESQNDKTLSVCLDLVLSKKNQLEFGQANQEKSLTVVN